MLNNAFKNYQVVWIDRDPRAVVGSMIRLRWFFKKKPNEYEAMTEEERISFYVDKYLQFYNSKFEFSNRIDVRYEDLVSNPIRFFENLLPKIGLAMPKSFENMIKNWNIKPIHIDDYKSAFNKVEWKIINSKLRHLIQ